MTRTMFALLMCTGIIPATVKYALTPTFAQTSQPLRFRSNDTQLRQWAVTSPKPAYPRPSIANKVTGVVVAMIQTNPTGATEQVEILQAPDPHTGRAVRDAVMQWTFKPMAFGAEGIVAFYFHLEGSRGVVMTPAEMRDMTNPEVRKVARADEPPAQSMTESEYQTLSTRVPAVVLDIRDRETFAEGHRKGAVNIPLGEILTRGAAELRVSRPIVIDCRDPEDVCAVAAHQITSSGFSRVFILRH